MSTKKLIRKWNHYFNTHLNKGESWSKIRLDLVARHGYKASDVEKLIINYRQDKAKQQKVNAAILIGIILMIMIIPFFIHKPTITGMVLGGGNNTDYLDIGNGENIVFVDINNPNCNDGYTRAQALNGETPWCTLDAPLTNDKLLSGDTLYIGAGEYNGESDITGWTITSNITISAYPGDQVNLTRYQGTRSVGTANGSNNLWVDDRDGTWYTIESDHESNYPWVYYENRTHFFTFSSVDDFSACAYSECTWFNTANHRLYVHFSDAGKNPNNVNIFISSNNQPLLIKQNTMSSGAYIIIQNLTFKYIKYGVQIDSNSNVLVQNNNFYGGFYNVYIRGRDVAGKTNIKVSNNYLWGGFRPEWTVEDIKAGIEETSPVYAEDFAGAVIVNNNLFNNTQGAVLLYNDAATEGDGSEIYNNTIIDSHGSVFEIENFAYNVKYYDNLVIDCHYAGVSFAPANCQASPTPCQFYNNIIVCNSTFKTAGGVDNDAWAIKAQSRVTGANNASNWNISHNTFIGRERALNGMVLSTGGTTDMTFADVDFKDNIFFSMGDYAIARSGYADYGVFYDYNLYYLEPSGSTALFALWNNGAAGNHYHTLTEALASVDWDGKWDTHSVQGNPVFADIENNDFTPTNLSVCTMSSTGSYVGAVPCEGNPSPECGDDVCNGNENCSTCEDDCGACPPPPNNAPTQSTPILNASDNPVNSTDATLNCYNQSTVDADGDSVTNTYRWFRNSSLVASLTSSSVGAGNTSVGESWKCEVKPYDGEDYGTAMNSSALLILAVCGDASCNGNENCSTCESDCGECPPEPVCGDASCNGDENCSTCESDCGICPVIANNITGCTLTNKSWNEDSSLASAYNLSSCFDDALGHTLIFTAAGNSSTIISIGSNGIVNLSAPADWNGVEHIIFTATDSTNKSWTNSTNNITLTVNAMADCGDSSCDGGETCNSCSADCGTCPVCAENWSCTEWAACSSSTQTRTCTDANACNTTTDKPAESQSCTSTPSSTGGGGGGGSGGSVTNESASWNCGEWSACVKGKQTQTCTHVTRNVQKTNTRNCEVINETKAPTEQKPGKVTSNQTVETGSKNKQTGLSLEGSLEANEDLAVANRIQNQYPDETMFGSKESARITTLIATGLILACLSIFFYFNGGKRKIKKLISRDEVSKIVSRNRKQQSAGTRQKTRKTAENNIQTSSNSQNLKRESPSSSIEHLEQLHKYVKEATKIGYTRERVSSELSSVGWEASVIETVLGMHKSEFLPSTIPETEIYPETNNTQIQNRYGNSIPKWVEFEDPEFKEKENEKDNNIIYNDTSSSSTTNERSDVLREQPEHQMQ